MAGRSRGESKNVHIIDDERSEEDRQQQLQAASILGMAESDIPVRGRGGFRRLEEPRTIPENVTQIKATRLGNARQINILANYVPITQMEDRFVHAYRIDFEPEVESQSLMRFLFRSAARDIFAKTPIYDGAHECRSGQKLQNDTTNISVEDSREANRKYTVKITHTGQAGYGAEMLRIYNMHMKDFLRALGYYSPQVGIFVHQDDYTPVGPEIMMLRGYRTAANVHDCNRILMNLEAAHKLVQNKNVLQLMNEKRQQLMSGQRSGNLREVLREELIGKVVVTSYDKRIYRVEDIMFDVRPTSTFDRKGTPITYLEYYQTVHNKRISDPQQPLLKVTPNNQRRRDEGDNREILLVPELCNIAGLTTVQRSDNRLKFELIRASQVPPNDRVKHMRNFLQKFHANADIRQQLSSWGYNYGNDLVRLQAHVVAMTGYATKNNVREPLSNWPRANINSADINVNDLAVTPTIKKMAVIITRQDLRDKARILGAIRQGFDKVGLVVASAPNMIEVSDGDSARHYIENVRRIPPDTDVAIVVMHSQNKERYDAIKKAASVERGLITQVVTARLMMDEKKARSAAQKIAIQIAAKVGGEPWWVDIPLKKAMICGYDTYHDTAQRGRSYGAFVASLNPRFSRWWSKADAHDRLDEISSQISTNIIEAVNQYMRFNDGELPEKVFIYRDGVGEGQLAHVFGTELKKIMAAIADISPNIKLTMVIVNKKIGARFYMRGTDNNFLNPPPGTVIDHTVTRHDRYDFYLISQSTRQGTVTPTYYSIIHDESTFNPGIHQQLAFKLSLLYYNWSGTVRVPAPCQYAHKLALLCGEHLHAQPNANLDDKLHFL